MLNLRNALITLGLVFGAWEAFDIFWIDVWEMALLFSVLFLACTVWYWRRESRAAVAGILVLSAFEAAAAPELKNVMTVTKVADFSLGLAGVICALAVLVTQLRARRTLTA
jgi:hypothetical protein